MDTLVHWQWVTWLRLCASVPATTSEELVRRSWGSTGSLRVGWRRCSNTGNDLSHPVFSSANGSIIGMQVYHRYMYMYSTEEYSQKHFAWKQDWERAWVPCTRRLARRTRRCARPDRTSHWTWSPVARNCSSWRTSAAYRVSEEQSITLLRVLASRRINIDRQAIYTWLDVGVFGGVGTRYITGGGCIAGCPGG